jgi:hypothetical protein
LDLAKKIDRVNNNLILPKHQEGNIAWILSAKICKQDLLQKVLDWAEDNLTTESIKSKLLLTTDRDGNTAWHSAAFRDKQVLLHKIWY